MPDETPANETGDGTTTDETAADEATAEIMHATYRALCKHGYAAVTMQDIADESSKSKAALHYYYDSKQDLLEAFLDHLLERFTDRVDDSAGATPAADLLAFLDAGLTSPSHDNPQEFQTAILEIKAQAPYNDVYREHLAEFDRLITDHVRSIVTAGVERGVFREDVDPDETASFLVTVVSGAQTRQVAVGHSVEETRERLREYVSTHLLPEDRTLEGDE